jgi:hypothetical protein
LRKFTGTIESYCDKAQIRGNDKEMYMSQLKIIKDVIKKADDKIAEIVRSVKK